MKKSIVLFLITYFVSVFVLWGIYTNIPIEFKPFVVFVAGIGNVFILLFASRIK